MIDQETTKKYLDYLWRLSIGANNVLVKIAKTIFRRLECETFKSYEIIF